jgi:hypothetical protein
MRRWLPYVLVPVVVLAAGAGWWYLRAAGDPSAAELRGALADAGVACGLEIRGFDMGFVEPDIRKARELVCRGDVSPPPGEPHRVAVHYVFGSDEQAKDWLASNDYGGPDWWLNDGTLVGNVDVRPVDWARALAALRD